MDSSDPIETLWEQLLSRQPEQVRRAFATLPPHEQAAVLAHLHVMTHEPGWHIEQQRSAQAALDALASA